LSELSSGSLLLHFAASTEIEACTADELLNIPAEKWTEDIHIFMDFLSWRRQQLVLTRTVFLTVVLQDEYCKSGGDTSMLRTVVKTKWKIKIQKYIIVSLKIGFAYPEPATAHADDSARLPLPGSVVQAQCRSIAGD
jgi:hypothetical protein